MGRRFVFIVFIAAFPEHNVSQFKNKLTCIVLVCHLLLQYFSMLTISIFIVATGLVWPYRDVFSNILDLFLSVDVMFLLLLRSTGQFKDELGAVTLEGTNSSTQCVEYTFEPSNLSYVILPFYYLPLLLLIVAFCVWMFFLLR